MKKLSLILATALALAAGGCAPQVDIEAERAALLAADAEARDAATAMDAERWLSLLTDDAVWLPSNRPLLEGKEAIGLYLTEQFAAPGFALHFPEPSKGEVSRAGDLGYTLGPFELTVNDAAGNAVTLRGKYVAIRRKQPDGSWKEVVSISNFDQPPGAGPAE